MMRMVTSPHKDHGIVASMIVNHDNGGILMNKAIKPKQKSGEKFTWSTRGLWLQPHVECRSTNITQIVWNNTTQGALVSSWVAKLVINKTDLRLQQPI